MERVTKIVATISMTALAAGIASAQPRTFLGPTAHFGVVKTITDDSAFALAGDVGAKNLRASGTIGWEFDYHQRVKGTAEYLRQKLTYSFFDGQQDEWVGQAAAGVDYQYDFRQVEPFNTLLDLSAYYSHSPSKGLGVTSTPSGTFYKRIAGANAFGVGPGISIATLDGTTAGLALNYDNVHYDTKNRSALTVKGLGGTVNLGQAITDDVKIGASAAIRKPYNNYGATISYGNIEYYGLWSLSAFGDYTIGKSTLPSSYNVGIGADYFIDATNDTLPPQPQPQSRPSPKQYKDYKDYKDMPPLVWVQPEVVDKDLLTWVGVPAVRIPTVYTVVDQKCVGGAAPRLVSPIPDLSIATPPPVTYNIAPYFSGNNLTYTISVVDHNSPTDSTVTISGSVITMDWAIWGIDSTITVTASNGCGSVSSTFTAQD